MTEAQKGNIYILGEMILWPLFPVVSTLGLAGMSGIVSLFWVNVVATLFYIIVMFARGSWSDLRNKKVWLYSLGIVFFICVMLYVPFFYALSYTTPTNAAIVALFEIVPTYIFFHVIRKDPFKKKHILGICFAVIGALIVLLPTASGVHLGDWIILGAVFFPPAGNYFQQKARHIASAESILFLRHLLSVVIFGALVYLFGDTLSLDLPKGTLGWLIINGIFIFGVSKMLWVEAVHRMSVTRALAIASISPAFTALFSWIILGQAPTLVQLISIPFLVAGVCILTNVRFSKKNEDLID